MILHVLWILYELSFNFTDHENMIYFIAGSCTNKSGVL